VIAGVTLISEPDLAEVTALMKYLHPENCIVFFSHKGVEGTTSLTEKWYGTKYDDKKMTSDQLTAWKRAFADYASGSEWCKDLFLPSPNTFIPTDFEIQYKGPKKSILENDGEAPALIERVISNTLDADIPLPLVEAGGAEEKKDLETAGKVEAPVTASTLPGRKLMTWHLQDKKWMIPKTNVLIKLETMHAYSTPLNVALMDLFANVLEEALVDLAYYADCAGLHYSVQNSNTGLDITCYGYHHKLALLVTRIVEVMKELSTGACVGQEDMHLRMKEKVETGYKNFKFSQPYMQCMVSTLNCLDEPRWTMNEKLQALQLSTYADFKSFCSVFLRQLHTEMFVHGNATVGRFTHSHLFVLLNIEITCNTEMTVRYREVVV
jgi:insulysin